MADTLSYDVIIIGGSYSGLAAGMALGRSSRKVMVIDSGKACNRQTPHSHNFLTQDGKTPAEISRLARQQVEAYRTVEFIGDMATAAARTATGFELNTASGKTYNARKLIFATGIKDLMPDIPGFSECWGISVIHCPYCHGYEVRDQATGILGNGDLLGFEFPIMISHWTKHLVVYTNGAATHTEEQRITLKGKQIALEEKEIDSLEHDKGQIRHILFKDGSKVAVKALYGPRPFEQHCRIPEALGCELTEEGYLKTDPMQKTSVNGVFACGDNASRLRTVANAVAAGTAAGMMLNREMIFEEAGVKPTH